MFRPAGGFLYVGGAKEEGDGERGGRGGGGRRTRRPWWLHRHGNVSSAPKKKNTWKTNQRRIKGAENKRRNTSGVSAVCSKSADVESRRTEGGKKKVN